MESIQNQLQEIKQTKLAKLIAVTNGEVVIIKRKGNNKGFTTYKVEKENYEIPFFFKPFKRREKLLQENKIVANVIIQSFSYLNLVKNKINKPIYTISGFKQYEI